MRNFMRASGSKVLSIVNLQSSLNANLVIVMSAWLCYHFHKKKHTLEFGLRRNYRETLFRNIISYKYQEIYNDRGSFWFT